MESPNDPPLPYLRPNGGLAARKRGPCQTAARALIAGATVVVAALATWCCVDVLFTAAPALQRPLGRLALAFATRDGEGLTCLDLYDRLYAHHAMRADRIFCADLSYATVDEEALHRFVMDHRLHLHSLTYESSRRDCDDFALILLGAYKRRPLPARNATADGHVLGDAVGFATGHGVDEKGVAARHAFLVAFGTDGALAIDAQTGRLVPLQDYDFVVDRLMI